MRPMFNFIEQGSLYAHDLREVWKKVPAEYVAILSITLANDEVYEPHTQFDVFYNGRRLKYMDIRVAECKFLSIFFDNVWLLTQIEQQQSILEELTDFSNWGDVTTTTGNTDNTNKLTATSELNNKNVGSNTDNNSNVDTSLLSGFMDVEDTQVIPANSMSQNKTKENSTTTSDSIASTSTIGKTSTSNTSQDYIDFLNLKINQLRTDFYTKFGIMFTL